MNGWWQDEARYILFDGDVDAVWVESMNSVMDDNKLLTLANGERIRLQPYARLLFEVSTQGCMKCRHCQHLHQRCLAEAVQ